MHSSSFGALAVLSLGIAGCAGRHLGEPFPEPRPLGRDLPGAWVPAVAESGREPSPGVSAEPEGPITVRDALAAALLRNPELSAFSWEVRAAEARRLQASLFPNPELSVEIENVSGELEGFRQAETTVSLAQCLILGGKRARAIRVAAIGTEIAGWEYESKRLDLYAHVVQAFVSVLGAQARLEVAEEMRGVAERVLRAAEKRVDVGAASPVERTRAQVALSRARNEVVAARQALESARIRLALAWGSAEPKFARAEGSLAAAVELPPLPSVRERLVDNPDLVAAAARLRMREAALQLERSSRIPDVTLSAGYRRLEGEDADTMVFGLSVPIPAWNLSQGTIREASANLSRAEWEERTVRAAAEAALADVYSELSAALEEAREYRETILPGAEDAFRKTQEGYEQGRFDYLELLTAQETLAKTRGENVDVLVRLNQAIAKMERLLAAPIATVQPRRSSP